MRHAAKVVAIALAVTALAAAAARGGGKNLEYFSQDMSAEDLKAQMKKLQRSLGVKGCEHCHVVSPKRDFASDAVANKKTARAMLKMTDRINKELFTKEALGLKEAPTATCFMCHRGKAKPELEPSGAEPEKARAKFEEDVKKDDHAQAAAAMKKMVEKLNSDVLTWKDAPKATCWMCHRGSLEPATKLPDEEK